MNELLCVDEVQASEDLASEVNDYIKRLWLLAH